MFGLFTWFGSMVIALGYLVWVIVLPFFTVWFLLSVRRSLARIADSLERRPPIVFDPPLAEVIHERVLAQPESGRVANSAFGR